MFGITRREARLLTRTSIFVFAVFMILTIALWLVGASKVLMWLAVSTCVVSLVAFVIMRVKRVDALYRMAVLTSGMSAGVGGVMGIAILDLLA